MRKPNRAAKGNGILAPASVALKAVVLEQRVPTEVRRERARLARVIVSARAGTRPPARGRAPHPVLLWAVTGMAEAQSQSFPSGIIRLVAPNSPSTPPWLSA